MGNDSYDLLVRGVREFQEIARAQAPTLSVALDKQMKRLEEDLKHTSFNAGVAKSLRKLRLEQTIRDFIREYRPQLINLAAQHSPYMEKGTLTPFVNRPIFFRLLKEEKDILFDFEKVYSKNKKRYKELRTPYEGSKELTHERLVEIAKNHYHIYRNTPTGGTRPKRLLPIANIFQTHLEENYYAYKRRPFIFLKMPAYRLVAALDLWKPALYIHAEQSGKSTPKWEAYAVPRKVAWTIHGEAIVEAIGRAYRNNESTPWPKEEAGDDPDAFSRKEFHTTATSTPLETVRKKLTTMTTKSYFDPVLQTVDIVVPITRDGAYCDVSSEFAYGLLSYEIHGGVPYHYAQTSANVFRKILPFALVSNPGEAVPLRDFVRHTPKDTVRWMVRHLQPTEKT